MKNVVVSRGPFAVDNMQDGVEPAQVPPTQFRARRIQPRVIP